MITTIDMGCYRSSANSGRQAQKADRTCATIGPSNDRPWGPHEEAHQAGDGLLHPTQVTAGMLEVEEKRKHFQPLSGDDLRRAIKALPMPAVLGRDGKHFIIDHHHLGRALWDAPIDYAYVDVVSDFSKLATEAFWSEIDLPAVPTLDEVRRYATARLAQTPSLDEIAISARRRLLDLVHSRLIEVAGTPSTG